MKARAEWFKIFSSSYIKIIDFPEAAAASFILLSYFLGYSLLSWTPFQYFGFLKSMAIFQFRCFTIVSIMLLKVFRKPSNTGFFLFVCIIFYPPKFLYLSYCYFFSNVATLNLFRKYHHFCKVLKYKRKFKHCVFP